MNKHFSEMSHKDCSKSGVIIVVVDKSNGEVAFCCNGCFQLWQATIGEVGINIRDNPEWRYLEHGEIATNEYVRRKRPTGH